MKAGKPSLLLQYPEWKLFHSILLFFLFNSQVYFAAAQAPISGIVNTYYKVIEFIPAKACVRVTSPAGLAYNDKVMLIQMKGASINTSAGSSAFGNISSLNNAGNYEIATICTVIGDSVFFVFEPLNQYTVGDKVQLVKIPQYVSATVTATLKPASWNNATGLGGVLAIIVEGDLTLNAPVYADSSGFQGGAYKLSDGFCTDFFPANDYAYNANDALQNGASKGEGIADVSAAQSGGRGAPANGGGGGNNHNNSGAGGANLSAGGNGGGNSSSSTCTFNFQGLAGKALNSSGGNKIFPGGGGGAGHANNTATSNPRGGGNGGGIVFISANNVIGMGNKISANGRSGGPATGDGAGGGGAGGTIILNVNTYSGSLTVEANGGQGGSVDDELIGGKCYGGGGGGSGGLIYFSGPVPAITATVVSGIAGSETNRSGSCNTAVPGSAGTVGQMVPNYTYASSLILQSNYCTLPLPVELIEFKASYSNGITELKWTIAQPETALHFVVERSADGRNWLDIHTQPAIADIPDYGTTDPVPMPKTNFYRLRMTDINRAVTYSSVQKIFIPAAVELVKIYPNPAGKKVFISGNTSCDELLLFDPSGKLVWKKRLDTRQAMAEINLPELQTGIYVIRLGDVIRKISIW